MLECGGIAHAVLMTQPEPPPETSPASASGTADPNDDSRGQLHAWVDRVWDNSPPLHAGGDGARSVPVLYLARAVHVRGARFAPAALSLGRGFGKTRWGLKSPADQYVCVPMVCSRSAPRPATRALAWLATISTCCHVVHGEAADDKYLRAQAPPPSPSTCEAWCPRRTCCSFCDDPACKGCGAVKECGMAAAPSSGKAPNEPKAKPHVAPGFQSGPDGFLYANGKRFHVKGINWWGSETVNAVPGGLQRRTMDELLDFIAEQGFNAIRLLLNHHSVLVNGKVNQGGKHHNWTDPYPEGWPHIPCPHHRCI